MTPRRVALVVLLVACGSGTSGLADLQRLEIVDFQCGVVGCSNARAQVVDFDAGVIERHVCLDGVDGGSARWGANAGDAISFHAVSAAQLASVRQAVADLRLIKAPITFFDGAMSSVSVTTASRGTQLASPEAACGDDPFQKIVAGYLELRSLVDGL